MRLAKNTGNGAEWRSLAFVDLGNHDDTRLPASINALEEKKHVDRSPLSRSCIEYRCRQVVDGRATLYGHKTAVPLAMVTMIAR